VCERFDFEVEAEQMKKGEREREKGKVKAPRSYSPICKVVSPSLSLSPCRLKLCSFV
jgi:hypothetical protein